MQIFSAADTHALLPYTALATALRNVLAAQAAGQAGAPPRQAVALNAGGTLLLMPATGPTLAIVKLVTVHQRNGERGLPSVQGEVLAIDAATGRRLFLLDGAAVTARRTAALSLLAAHLLAPQQRGPLLIVGAGVQARAHLEAFVAGKGVQEVWISSRTIAHAEALAAAARQQGIVAQAITDPSVVIDQAAFIVTATTSTQPVMPDHVRDDVFIAAVGAYQPHMVEVPAALVRRSAVFVDTLEGAQHEAGDLIQAGVDWAQVTPLSDDLQPPTGKRPILFKSVGHALWDLAAAQLVYRQRETIDH